jgi:hypothetical protein
MKTLFLILTLISCSTKSGGSGDGGGDDTDGGSHDGGGSNGDGGGSAYVCTPLAGFGAACCVFDATTLCDSSAGSDSCQYDYTEDNSTYTSPSQGAGTCRKIGTLALGATCPANVLASSATCGTGAWCAYDSNSGTTGTGTCRKLCDPLDQAAHGCTTGTCVGMLYCADFAMWPNCPSATNTHLGFCQ